jgi:hypothetical protein
VAESKKRTHFGQRTGRQNKANWRQPEPNKGGPVLEPADASRLANSKKEPTRAAKPRSEALQNEANLETSCTKQGSSRAGGIRVQPVWPTRKKNALARRTPLGGATKQSQIWKQAEHLELPGFEPIDGGGQFEKTSPLLVANLGPEGGKTNPIWTQPEPNKGDLSLVPVDRLCGRL